MKEGQMLMAGINWTRRDILGGQKEDLIMDIWWLRKNMGTNKYSEGILMFGIFIIY